MISKPARSETATKLLRFLLAGIPGFAVAVSLNLFLLHVLDWSAPIAYAAVLLVQVSINFFFCLYFAFDRNTDKSVVNQFLVFVSGIFLVRVVDWLLYVALTELLGVPYIVAQLFNMAVFSIVKFTHARLAIEGP